MTPFIHNYWVSINQAVKVQIKIYLILDIFE